jgi:chromosome segregation ATPase
LMLQGKPCIAFAIVTLYRKQRRTIQTLEHELSKARQQLTEAQQKLASSEQQQAEQHKNSQGLVVVISVLKQALEVQAQQANQAAADLKSLQQSSTAKIAGLITFMKVQVAQILQKVAAAQEQSEQREQYTADLEVHFEAQFGQLYLSQQQLQQAQQAQLQASAQVAAVQQDCQLLYNAYCQQSARVAAVQQDFQLLYNAYCQQSAQVAAVQQDCQLLYNAYCQQSAQLELYIWQWMADQRERAGLCSRIAQLESEQAWVQALVRELKSNRRTWNNVLMAALTLHPDSLQGVDAEVSAPAAPAAQSWEPHTPRCSQ